jgi:capsid portal protein
MTKGKVFLLNSANGEIVKTSGALTSAALAPLEFYQAQRAAADGNTVESARLAEKQGCTVGGVQCAARPFDIAAYAYATVVNTYHMRACRAKVKDIVGRRWSIAGEGTDAAKSLVTEFFRNAFGELTFGEGMGNVWMDYEALGSGFVEVIPDIKGQPAGLRHIPATELFIRLDGLGFVQAKNGQFAQFRTYGLKPDKFAALPKTDGLATAPTSVIPFIRYLPFSPFYGLPSVMPAFPALALMVLIREYNLQFFSNNAIPDYAVILEGEWADDAEKTISEYFKTHLKGQAHKTLCLQTPSGGKVTFEPLTSQTVKEGSFRLLWVEARDEVLQAHGVPPQKVGIVETGKLGGNLSSEQIVEYKTSIVEPGQEKVSTRLSMLIKAFGAPNLKFQFDAYDTEDRQANAAVDQIYLNAGVLTPNEVREVRFPGKDPLEGGDQVSRPAQFGDVAGVEDVLNEVQQSLRGQVAA